MIDQHCVGTVSLLACFRSLRTVTQAASMPSISRVWTIATFNAQFSYQAPLHVTLSACKRSPIVFDCRQNALGVNLASLDLPGNRTDPAINYGSQSPLIALIGLTGHRLRTLRCHPQSKNCSYARFSNREMGGLYSVLTYIGSRLLPLIPMVAAGFIFVKECRQNRRRSWLSTS